MSKNNNPIGDIIDALVTASVHALAEQTGVNPETIANHLDKQYEFETLTKDEQVFAVKMVRNEPTNQAFKQFVMAVVGAMESEEGAKQAGLNINVLKIVEATVNDIALVNGSDFKITISKR